MDTNYEEIASKHDQIELLEVCSSSDIEVILLEKLKSLKALFNVRSWQEMRMLLRQYKISLENGGRNKIDRKGSMQRQQRNDGGKCRIGGIKVVSEAQIGAIIHSSFMTETGLKSHKNQEQLSTTRTSMKKKLQTLSGGSAQIES